MTDHDRMSAANALIEAFNQGNWQWFRDHCRGDVVYEEFSTGRRIEGLDAYIEAMQGWRQVFPDATGTVTTSLTGEDAAAQELRWTGTQQGELPLPTGSVPASGKRIDVAAAIYYQWDGDKVRNVRHYFDLLTLLQQVGAAPAPAQASA